jgi:hypothetical protein
MASVKVCKVSRSLTQDNRTKSLSGPLALDSVTFPRGYFDSGSAYHSDHLRPRHGGNLWNSFSMTLLFRGLNGLDGRKLAPIKSRIELEEVSRQMRRILRRTDDGSLEASRSCFQI